MATHNSLWTSILNIEDHMGGREWNYNSFFGWLAGVYTALILSGALLPYGIQLTSGTNFYPETSKVEWIDLLCLGAISGICSALLSAIVMTAVFKPKWSIENNQSKGSRLLAYLALVVAFDAVIIQAIARASPTIHIPPSSLVLYFLYAVGTYLTPLAAVAWLFLYQTHTLHLGGEVTKVTERSFTCVGFVSMFWWSVSFYGGFMFPEGPSRWLFWVIVPAGSLHLLSSALQGNFDLRPQPFE
ncbi:hypothetical protein DL96DRAFT_1635761, partial [Flagelloscypha sp. PMI_526]